MSKIFSSIVSRVWLIASVMLATARNKPWQPLLIILAVMVATGGLSAVLLINEGARQGELGRSEASVFSGAAIVARTTDEPLTQRDYVQLRRAGFTSLVAMAEQTDTLQCMAPAAGADSSFSITLIGMDMLALSSSSLLKDMQGAAAPGAGTSAPPTTAAVSYAPPQLAHKLQCEKALSRSRGVPLSAPLAVTQLPAETLLVSLRAFYTQPTTLQNTPLSALLVSTTLSETRLRDLKNHLPAHLQYQPPPVATSNGTLAKSFQMNLWAMGVLMGVVALFIVLNALTLMYRARLLFILRLRQLGVSKASLLLALMSELALYCSIAAPLGVLAAVVLTRQLTPVLQATFKGLLDSAFVAPSPLLTEMMSGAFIASFAALALFFVIPARQLSSALLASQARGRPMSLVMRGMITIVVVSLVMLGLALADSTITALLAVAGVLLGGCGIIVLWLPAFTALISKLTPASRPLLSYVAASTHGLSSKSRLSVCAFFIALAANIGMNVMTDSFREATQSWLQQRLAAPVYLYTEAKPSANNFAGHIDARHLYQGSSTVNQQRVTVRSYAADATARNSLTLDKLVPDGWSLFAQNQAVFINQQLAFRHNIQLGDSLTLGPVYTQNTQKPVISRSVTYTVAAVYPDYGNPDSQLLLPLTTFSPDSGYAGVTALYGAAPADLTQLASIGEIYPSPQLLKKSMQTFDRTFVVTDALNIATLLVAGMAFAVSVSVITLDLRPQLNVLRTMGVGQWQVKAMLTAQYMLLCLVTALLALPFGILLAWVFINLVNRFAFFWVYPMQISAMVLLSSLALSLFVVLIILLLPVARMEGKVDLRQETPL